MIQMPLQCWRSCQAGGEAGTSLSKARLGYEHQSGTEQISKSLHRSLIPGHTSTATQLVANEANWLGDTVRGTWNEIRDMAPVGLG